MEIKANVKHVRISPRKMRLVADVVRGLGALDALAQLKFSGKKAADTIIKLISSAIANAEHNYELDKNNLFVKEIKVEEGVTMKRWLPRAHGRATPLRKRMSHVRLVMGEIKDSGIVAPKQQEIEKPVNLEDLVKQSSKETKKGSKAVAEKGKEEVKSEGHTKKEDDRKGDGKGFVNKIFRRKSG